MSRKKSILFICLGNICRSPTAEALFRHLVEERGLEDQWHIDSAAVMDYWIGNRPDDRTLDVLHRHNINSDHRVRQVKKEDFKKFDYIVGMDDDNMSDLHDLDPKANRCELLMLGYYDPEGQHIVKDPFYGHAAGFETMYEHCHRCCQALLTALT